MYMYVYIYIYAYLWIDLYTLIIYTLIIHIFGARDSHQYSELWSDGIPRASCSTALQTMPGYPSPQEASKISDWKTNPDSGALISSEASRSRCRSRV